MIDRRERKTVLPSESIANYALFAFGLRGEIFSLGDLKQTLTRESSEIKMLRHVSACTTHFLKLHSVAFFFFFFFCTSLRRSNGETGPKCVNVEMCGLDCNVCGIDHHR